MKKRVKRQSEEEYIKRGRRIRKTEAVTNNMRLEKDKNWMLEVKEENEVKKKEGRKRKDKDEENGPED